MPFEETCVMDEKVRFCVAYERGDVTMAELCRQYGVSRKTGYQVWQRFQADGAAGLMARSHAPLSCPHGLNEAVVSAVLAVRRRYPSWGPKKIKARLAMQEPGQVWPAASTIGDVLSRHGLVVPRRCRRHVAPATQPFAACAGANDLWSMDFKGWFRTSDGQRIDPFTLQDQASRFLLRLVPVAQTNTAHVQAVLETAFREYGLPKAIRSDNGPPFGSTGLGGLSQLSVWLIRCGVMPDHIDPASPQQNGRLERMHKDLKAETAAPPASSLRAQSQKFKAFRHTYNHERPHEALGQCLPGAVYQASPRRWNGRPHSPDYADDSTVRRVRSNGEIKWHGHLVYLNSALAGEPVALDAIADNGWRVSYGPVTLATIDAQGRLKPPHTTTVTRRRKGSAFTSTNPVTSRESVTHPAG
jgi:putative transposase